MECSSAFLDLIQQQSLAVLNNIVMMDESTISSQTAGMKRKLIQWVKKGQPGPVKGGVHTTRSNQMVLVFF